MEGEEGLHSLKLTLVELKGKESLVSMCGSLRKVYPLKLTLVELKGKESLGEHVW